MDSVQLVTIAANIVAIIVLVFGIYFPRHHNRDLVVSFLGINAGVLAVATILSTIDVSLGVGIGLFGVLSIIRLRSDELDQREVAYYFASLALGLLGGTVVEDYRLTIGLMALLLMTLWFGDHPGLLGAYRTQDLTVDRAFVDESQLASYLAPTLGGSIRSVSILKTDLVNDTTLATVSYTRAPTSSNLRDTAIGALMPADVSS